MAASEFCASIGETALRLMVAPKTLEKGEVYRCRELFMRGRALGRQDLNASILIRALIAVREANLAQETETEYRHSRRELTNGLLDFSLSTS